MKSIVRRLLAFTCLFAFGLGATTVARAGENGDPPKGSIRTGAKTKPADLPGLAKITFQKALASALARSPGSVIKGELEVEDGILMYSFEIVGANQTITEVEIDAGLGTVLGTEDETNGGHRAPGTDPKLERND